MWFAMMLVSIAALLAALPEPAFGRSDSVAAMFPPWWSQEHILASAAKVGPLLDVGGWSSVALFAFTDPGLPDRLRRSGAILVIDARAVGCFSSRQ